MSFVRKSLSMVLLSTAIVVVQPPPGVRAAPVPVATVSPVDGNPLIGEEVEFVVTFDNADSTDVGFGPYVDLSFDVAGVDGDDGMSFTSAQYLGADIAPLTVETCTGAPFVHPLTGLSTPCPAGREIVVLQLPFGSFTPGQPVASIDVLGAVSNLADAGAPLDVTATPAFAYGDSAVGTTPILGTAVSTSVTPEAVRFTKTYPGPEQETATGPNFPRQFRLDVDIATGQTVVDLRIVDRLASQYAYLSATPSIAGATTEPPVGVPSSPPDNLLSHLVSGNTVGASGVDASLVVDYFVADLDSTGAVVIDPSTGDDLPTSNDGEANGTLDPLDPRDDPTPFVFDSPTVDPGNDDDAEVVAKSIAVQKEASIAIDVGGAGVSPSDTLEYRIKGQISDYFTFGSVTVDDVLSDGQTFDPSFTPTLSITEGGSTTAAALAGFFTVDTSERTTCGAGTTSVTFDVSGADAAGSGNGILTGGRVNGAVTGPTSFEIVFRSVVSDQYQCSAPGALDPNDPLANDVSVRGEVYDNTSQGPQAVPRFEEDTSSIMRRLESISIEKSIWARNGVVGGLGPSPVQFAAGDDITYRLRLSLPSSDFTDLTIADFLPLPVLQASPLTRQVANCTASTAPALGDWCFGPGDTLSGAPGFVAPPDPAVDSSANSVTWDFGTQEFTDNLARAVEILFTVQITTDPFRDGLFLTNQVLASEENSFAEDSSQPAIDQIELTQPVLNVRKGVVETSTQTPAAVFSGTRLPTGVTFDPVTAASPCPDFTGTISTDNIANGAPNANVTGLDAADLVRFAIVVENTGSGTNGAFDVTISDLVPSGFELPAGGPDLCVTDGAGAPLANAATGFFVGTPSSSGIIELTDGVTGALGPSDPTSGTNVAVVSYTLQLVDDIGADTRAPSLTNTAEISNYSATEGGASFVPITPAGDLVDTASAATKRLTIDKQRTDTSQPSTSGRNVAIGEEVEYTVTVTVPEGLSRDVTIVDSLPAGLEISRPPTAAVLGSALMASAIGGPSLSPDSRVLTFDFGDVTNTDDDNSTTADETITLTYWAVVTNVLSNQRGTNLRNNAAVSYQRGNTGTATSTHRSRQSVRVVEPTLRVRKSASSPTIDANDMVTFSITVDHSPGSPTSNADAFEVSLTDAIPSGLNYVGASLTSAGTAPTTLTESGGVIDATWTSFPLGSSTTISFDVTVDATYSPVAPITNTATIGYTGLPGDPTTSLGNPTGVERTGADGVGGLNDYVGSGSATIDPIAPTIDKQLVDSSSTSTASPTVTIGEVVTYDLTVRLPEGELTGGFTVTDRLPAGLRYQAGSYELFAAPGVETPPSGLTQPFAGSLGADVLSGGVGDGDDVVVTFGPTTVAPDGNPDNNAIVVRIDALVLDVPGNVGVTPGQTTLENQGVVQIIGSTPVDSGIVASPVVEPRMVITKAFDPAAASQGDTVDIVLAVENTGLGTAFDVVIEDVLDANFTESTAAEVTTPPGFVYGRSGSTITYTGGDIVAGATVVFRFSVALDTPLPVGTAVANTATVTQATTLPGTDPNERDEPDVQGNATLNTVGPDLTLDKDDGVLTIAPGNQTTYNLVVTNVGGFQATGVVITDTLPAGTTYVSVGGPGCSTTGPSGGDVPVAIAGVIAANGGTATCSITVEMTDPAPAGTSGYRNVASVADDGSNGPDPTPGNNTAEDVDVIVGRAPNLTVSKDDGRTELTDGEVTTYRIVVENTGNVGVTNVLARDTIPPGMSFVSCAPVTGTVSSPCVENAGIVTISFASIAGGGGTASFDVVAQVDSPVPVGITTVTNSVSVSDDGANGPETDLTDNSDTDVDTIVAAPDMGITKSHAEADVAPGGTVQYELIAYNSGDQDTTGVIVTDTVDPQMTVQCATVSPAPTSCDPGTGVIVWGTAGLGGLQDETQAAAGLFIGGGNRTLTYETVADDPVLAGTTAFANTATITDDEGTATGDPTPADTVADDSVPIAGNAPDLSIVKDDGETTVVPGQQLTYSLTVTNIGNIGATGVTVTDVLPASLSFVSCSDSCDSSALPSLTWTLPTLAGAGGSQTVSVTVDVVDPAADGVDEIVNTAAVTDDGTNGVDPTPGDNTDDDVDVLDAAPDLSIVKDDGETVRSVGDQFDYTITVSNGGNQTATGVTVIDTMPDNLTALSCPPTPVECVIDGAAGTVTWNIASISGGAGLIPPALDSTVTLSVTVEVGPVASGIDSFTNVVSVTDDGTNGPDPTPGDNTDDDIDVLLATPDLQVTKSDGVTTARPGETLVYDIVVTNAGGQAATGVTVSDTLPAGVSFVACSPACDSSALPLLTWNGVVEDVAGNPPDPTAFDAGGQATLTVTVTVDSPAGSGLDSIENLVVVADDGANGADPTPGDNSASDTDVIDAAPDLRVTKDDGVDTASDGDTLTYAIEYANTGDQDATGVVIVDLLPDEVSFVACSDGCDSTGAPTISWVIGDLPAGTVGTRTLTVRVNDPLDPAVRTIVNEITIADDGRNGPDRNPDDNSDTDVDGYGIDLAVTKSDGVSTVAPGDMVTYDIVVTNNGPSTIQQFTLVDSLPESLSDVTFAAEIGTYDPASGLWTDIGDFAAGDSVTLRVTGLVDPEATGELVNTVTVTPPDTVTDFDPTNNEAVDVDTLEPSSLITVEKELATDLVAGETARYDITVRNAGPSAAIGLVVTDPLPDGLVYQSASGTDWTCSAESNVVTCDYGEPLPAGSSASFSVIVLVVASAGDAVTNTATATLPSGLAPGSDPDDTALGTIEPSPNVPDQRPLPETGSNLDRLLTLASLLLVAGLLLLATRRRRRSALVR